MEDKEKEELLKRINQLEKQQAKSKRNKRILLIIVLIIALAIGGFFYYLHYQAWHKNDDIVYISKKELVQYITKIDITTENWQEYVVLEDVESENTNAFGDLESTSKSTEFKLADDIIGNVVLEINVNEGLLDKFYNTLTTQILDIKSNGIDTGTSYIRGLNDKNDDENYSDTTITINDFTVSRAEGTVYVIDMDAIAWENSEEGEIINIELSDGSHTYYTKDDLKRNAEELYQEEN